MAVLSVGSEGPTEPWVKSAQEGPPKGSAETRAFQGSPRVPGAFWGWKGGSSLWSQGDAPPEAAVHA